MGLCVAGRLRESSNTNSVMNRNSFHAENKHILFLIYTTGSTDQCPPCPKSIISHSHSRLLTIKMQNTITSMWLSSHVKTVFKECIFTDHNLLLFFVLLWMLSFGNVHLFSKQTLNFEINFHILLMGGTWFFPRIQCELSTIFFFKNTCNNRISAWYETSN